MKKASVCSARTQRPASTIVSRVLSGKHFSMATTPSERMHMGKEFYFLFSAFNQCFLRVVFQLKHSVKKNKAYLSFLYFYLLCLCQL